MKKLLVCFALIAGIATLPVLASAKDIAHDAEYYVLERQNGEKWAADDQTVDQKLTEFRQKNGGKPPNILYILIDDIGFGDLGIPELNAVRGYKTPTINQFSDAGMRFVRIIQRHAQRKQKYPDEGPARGVPYDGIENLRPESKAAVETFLFKQKTPTM